MTIKNEKECQSAIDEQTDLMMFVPETPEARRCDELDDEITAATNLTAPIAVFVKDFIPLVLSVRFRTVGLQTPDSLPNRAKEDE